MARKSRVCAEAYLGTASGHGQVRDCVQFLPVPPASRSVEILAGGPTARETGGVPMTRLSSSVLGLL